MKVEVKKEAVGVFEVHVGRKLWGAMEERWGFYSAARNRVAQSLAMEFCFYDPARTEVLAFSVLEGDPRDRKEEVEGFVVPF
jgi:hypothetical protein